MNKSVPPTMATKHIYNEIMIEKKILLKHRLTVALGNRRQLRQQSVSTSVRR